MGVPARMTAKAVILLFSGVLIGCVSSQKLVTLLPKDGHRITSKPCLQPGVESCTQALVNMTLLKTSDTILIPGSENEEMLLQLSSRSENSAVFRNGIGSNAYFTWNGPTLSGQVQSAENSWSLEGCGENCFSWVKQAWSYWKEETCEEAPKDGMSVNKKNIDHLKALGEADTETIVTYTVMMWHTQEFSNLFSSVEDMDTFTDLIILETNEAYINSNIPARIQKHPTITEEVIDSSTLLSAFKNSMSLSDLKNSADTAALLTADLSGCGIAYTGTTGSCWTLSVTKKSCATGYYSFGHEIGHNFGAKHNVEKYDDISSHPYLHGHGYLIKPTGPSKWTGYRTILAYNADGHYNRINRYSNPDQVCPNCLEVDSVMGDEFSNNAKVITDNRFAMAACGTEENTCSIPVATTTDVTATEAACVPKYAKNKTISGKKIKTKKKIKSKTVQDCWGKCENNDDCKYVTWVKSSKNKKQKKLCTLFSSSKKMKKKKGIMVAYCK